MQAEKTFKARDERAALASKLRRFVHLLTGGTNVTERIVSRAFTECEDALSRCENQRDAEAMLYRAALWAAEDEQAQPVPRSGAQAPLLERFNRLPLAEKAVVGLFAIDEIGREEAAAILGAQWDAVSDSLQSARHVLFSAKTGRELR